jgi:hypothetical protein
VDIDRPPAPIASEAYEPKETLDMQCNRLSGCGPASIQPS